jgi:hypothetical protein
MQKHHKHEFQYALFFEMIKTSEFMHKRLEWANRSNDDDGISHIQVVHVYRILLSLPAFQVTTETEHWFKKKID